MAYRQTSISENNYILRHTAKYHTCFIKFLLLEYLPELSRLARFDNIKIETSTERISVIYKYFIKALIILQNIFIKRSNSFPQCHLDKDNIAVRILFTASKHFVYSLFFYI